MPAQFQGKVALVTGGAQGIGRATALAFAKEGAKVVVADIQAPGGEETVSVIRDSGLEATFVKTDVTKSVEVENLIRQTVNTYGRLDYAHNNAGIEGTKGRLADYTEEAWDKTIAINLKGVWLCMKYEILEMLKANSGVIVNTASITSFVSFANFPAYTASKHGVIGLTRSAARAYGRNGIRINSVCPGMIDTDMIDRGFSGSNTESPVPEFFQGAVKAIGRKVLERKQVAGRVGLPAEVADAVIWLCSDHASFVNGHQLVIDGGFIA